MTQKVVILGGGVAGLSAAHELIERGYQVEVLEKLLLAGGKARSIPVVHGVNDHGGHAKAHHGGKEGHIVAAMAADPLGQRREWLPGEHGFRFFPNFYRHITDTMARIPYGKGTVIDNLVDTTEVLISSYDKPGIVMPSRFPRNLFEISLALRTFLFGISSRMEIPYAELEHFAACTWRILTSCQARRMDEYEKIGWWNFVGASDRSEAYQRLLAIGFTRSLVAAKAHFASAKTVGDIHVQLLLGVAAPGVSSDRLLNGPTNDVWIKPWLAYLEGKGLVYRRGAKVTGIQMEGGRVSGVTVQHEGASRTVTGDWYIGALPVERMAPLVTPAMLAVDPGLARLAPLSNSVQWMNGIQFYLTRDVPITHGHIIFIDSPWALTAVSQRQFWTGIDFADWGDGKTRGILSVDISQWNLPGLNGKAAEACTREEIAAEVWAQMKRSLNGKGEDVLRDEDLHHWFLDPDITNDPASPGRQTSVEPLLVNNANTWRLRPDAGTAIPNFLLAADYIRTHTDLATMEGANEAARRAVNEILERAGSALPRCEIWNLHEPEGLAPLRHYDKVRYEAGLPWDARMPIAVQAALALVQTETGMTTGGAGPLAPFDGLTAAVSQTAGPGQDPVMARALSMLGLPDGVIHAFAGHLPGIDMGVPGMDQASTLAAALALPAAQLPSPVPQRRRLRVVQKG